jgi:DNA-binding NarL/FixJ family response regulator
MIKVLLADDEPAVRHGLRMRLALDPYLVVVGEAGDGERALTQTGALRPDVVVMDVEMPALDGIAATERLRAESPGTAVVILSIHDDAATRAQAHAAGAKAFVSKHESPGVLLEAIHRAAEQTADC